MSRRRGLVLALGAMAVVVLSACQVRTEVRVEVAEDGSGVVRVTARLDADAARRLGDPATALRLDDLIAAGWTIEEPVRADDGALTIRGEREVGSPDQFATALAEVGGVDGVFRDVRVEIADRFASNQYTFAGDVELTGNLDQFGDPALTEVLGGLPLARTPEELAAEGATDPGSATLLVVVDLPGGDPTTDGTVRDGAATWEFPMAGGEPTSATVGSVSTVEDNARRFVILAGALLLIVALGLVGLGVARRRA